jgi:hypothetical protein
MAEILRQVDRGHASAPELAPDCVAIAEGISELGKWCGHHVPMAGDLSI